METFIKAFLITALVMAPIDAVWLKLATKRFYAKRIGHLMAESPNLYAGVLFYMIYASAVSVFVLLPSVNLEYSLLQVFTLGAFFGLVAYATYDLTNQATLKNWPIAVTAVDMVWGALLTGVVSIVSFVVLEFFL